MNYIRLFLLLLFCADISSSILYATGMTNFPAWMEDVSFEQTSQSALQQPLEPIDPETDLPTKTSSKSKQNWRKNLPNMGKMREKAAKSELEKTRKEENSLVEAFNFSLQNLDVLKNSYSELLSFYNSLPESEEAEEIQQELNTLQTRINACDELQSIFATNPQTPVASLTPSELTRARWLRDTIFKTKELKKPNFKRPNFLIEDSQPNANNNKSNFYKPSIRPSIYLESQQQKDEE